MLSPKTLRCPADLSLDDTKNQKQRDFVARYVTQEAEWLLEDMETTATEADQQVQKFEANKLLI